MLEFQLRKHKKSGIEITWRDLIMEAEVFDRSAELSIVTGSNLGDVFSGLSNQHRTGL